MIREVSDKIICILFKMGPLGRPQAPRGRDSKSSSHSSSKKCLLIQSVQHHLLKEGWSHLHLANKCKFLGGRKKILRFFAAAMLSLSYRKVFKVLFSFNQTVVETSCVLCVSFLNSTSSEFCILCIFDTILGSRIVIEIPLLLDPLLLLLLLLLLYLVWNPLSFYVSLGFQLRELWPLRRLKIN